jgi:hypothetical protein
MKGFLSFVLGVLGIVFIPQMALLADNGDSNAGLVKSVEAVGYVEKTIYHSPETPGYTAWVGLWQIPDGRIRCGFLQLTGPKGNIKSVSPNMESVDGGETWKMLPLPPTDYATGRGIAVLSDGTLIRPVQISPSVGYVQRSEDGGKSWSEPIYLLPLETHYVGGATLLHPLRDGRVVAFTGAWKRDDVAVGGVLMPYQHSRQRKMMFISLDKGLTWGEPIELMSLEDGVCDESDFCELPNGDLFWVHRCEIYPAKLTEIPPGAARMGLVPTDPWYNFYSDRKQSITRKSGDTFIPEKPELMKGVPHSGYPMILYTQEGIILNFQREAIYWTADLGKHWEKLNINISAITWYPKALQLADGKIICVSHVGLDDEYGTVDQSIFQQTFRLKVVR